MPGIGGPIQEINYAGRLFNVAADSDPTTKLGGLEADVQPNGNKTARLVMSASAWALSGVNVEIDHDREDLEFLQGRSDSKIFDEFSVTYCSGAVYAGRGHITGEVAASTLAATASINFMGPGVISTLDFFVMYFE